MGLLRSLLFAVAVLCACDESPSRTAVDGAISDGSLDLKLPVEMAAEGSVLDAPRTDSGSDMATGFDAAPPVLEGPLVGLPSQEKPHIAKIKALGADAWLELGPATADPNWGRARGRSWGGRAFILAPDIRGAFFTGEGKHAFVKPDGYAMDDIWVYDINAHAWIAVHPGTNTKDFNQQVAGGALLIDDNAQLVDDSGRPVPVHLLVHAWGFLSYDPLARKFAMVAGDGLRRYFLGGAEDMEQGLSSLEAQRELKTRPPMSPWFYDVVAGVFERKPLAGDSEPNNQSLFPFFQYVSSKKQFFLGSSQYVMFYDPVANAWTTVNDSGERPTGYDHGGCYDEKRDRIYLGPGANGTGVMYLYDIKTATWSHLSSSGTGPQAMGTNLASVMYDSHNDVVTVFAYKEKKIFTYVPDTDTWTSRALPDKVLTAVGYPSFNAFYDPQLNAYFCHAATDSGDNGVFWVYRYK